MEKVENLENHLNFKNRKNWIAFFGVAEIIMGLLLIVITLFQFVLVLGLSSKNISMPEINLYGIFFSVLMYFSLGVINIVLGIGVILLKKWARDLNLILSWGWLIIFVFSLIGVIFIIPMFKDTNQNFSTIIILIPIIIVFLIFISIPAIFVRFYSGKNVNSTFNYFDTKARWTEKIPLPVLTVVIILAMSPISIVMKLLYYPYFPLFGYLIVGVPALILNLGIAVFYLFLAKGFYQLKKWAWNALTGFITFLGITGGITLYKLGLIGFYEKLGMKEESIVQLKNINFPNSSFLVIMLISTSLMIGYLLFIKKYFDMNDDSEVNN